MISLYSGTVGSGKSFHATDLGLQWVSKKKYVIANYPIKSPDAWYMRIPRVKQYFDNQQKYWIFADEITPEYLIAKSLEYGWFGKESQCLLQIDEAGIPFNSRDWATDKNRRMAWIKFLSLSRKLGYDIVLIAQHDRMLDRQIRSLLEYDVKHLKANNSFFLRFLNIFKLTLFMYVYKWYGTKQKANLRFGRYRKAVANRYDTMRLFNMDELIVSVKKIYDGKIIPAPVMAQIEMWQSEIDKRMKDISASAGGDAGAGGPAAVPAHAENKERVKRAVNE